MGATTTKQKNYGPIDKSDFEPDTEEVKMTEEGLVDWEHELKKRVDDSDSEVETEVEGMVEKYDGLVSIEAAPILVGREKYDIDLVDEIDTSDSQGALEVANMTYEMRSVDIEASVKEVQDEFTKPDADWRVTNVVIEDTSGTTQIPFWNEKGDAIRHLKGDYEEKLVVEGAYTKTEEDVRDYHKSRHDAPPLEIGDSTTITVVYEDEDEEDEVVVSPDE